MSLAALWDLSKTLWLILEMVPGGRGDLGRRGSSARLNAIHFSLSKAAIIAARTAVICRSLEIPGDLQVLT